MEEDRKVWITSKRRLEISQSGKFDADLLCHDCERSLAASDDYAVRWSRTFDAKAKPGPNDALWSVANPKPDLLVKFAASVIWRSAMAPTHGDGIELGPWDFLLGDFIFRHGRFRPKVVVIRSNWRIGDEGPAKVVVGCTRLKSSHRTYHFEAGGFRWLVRLDDRQSGPRIFDRRLLVNDADPAPVLKGSLR